MDIDEDSDNFEAFHKGTNQDKTVPANPRSTLSRFIHMLRLMRIQTQIQHDIYRVDQEVHPLQCLIDGYLDKLSDWKRELPTKQETSTERTNAQSSVFGIGSQSHVDDLYVSLVTMLIGQASDWSIGLPHRANLFQGNKLRHKRSIASFPIAIRAACSITQRDALRRCMRQSLLKLQTLAS